MGVNNPNHNPNKKRSSGEQFPSSSGGALNKGLASQERGGMTPADLGMVSKGPNQVPSGNKKTGNFC